MKIYASNAKSYSTINNKSVNHGRGEYARDEHGDGFCEVHVNTMEEFWSLLRSWLRPHRGISQEKLPLYLGFFEFVHNVCRRGKALRGSLIELLVSKDPGFYKSDQRNDVETYRRCKAADVFESLHLRDL